MKKYFIKTFGCQMNVHDSEKISGLLENENCRLADRASDADIIIINTCSIRQKAEQKFYSSLGRYKSLKRLNPGMKIIVAGCIAQQEGRRILQRAPFVNHVIGPQHIGRIRDIIDAPDLSVLTEINDVLAIEEIPSKRHSAVRAWVNIMYGCNNFCSYCIVPYTRGREVSRPSGNIVDEVSGLAEKGFKEVTLLGQNVISYRSDTDFTGLLQALNKIEGIERIRFMTSHPRDLTAGFVYAMRDLDKVCEHIHLPLQSGSDRILRLMNRKYTYKEYVGKVDLLRKIVPHIAITTDIIAGFPSEDENNHKSTLQALRGVEYDGIFAFNYSPRPLTSAAKMEGHLDDDVKAERLTQILALQDEITLRKNEMLTGKTVEVLVDYHPETGQIMGRTRTNKIVNFRSGYIPDPGTLIRAHITTAHKHSLEANVIG